MKYLCALLIFALSTLSAFSQGGTGTTPTARYQTVAEMVAATVQNVPANSRLSALVTGRVTANDGGGGLFFFTPASVTATNLGTVFPSTGVAGRWFRSTEGVVTSLMFGVLGDSTTDGTAGLNDLFSVAKSSRSLVLIPKPSGTNVIKVTGTLILREGVIVSGEVGQQSQATNYVIAHYPAIANAPLFVVEAPDATWTRGVQLKNLSAYSSNNGNAGPAISLTNSLHTLVENCSFSGFQYGIAMRDCIDTTVRRCNIFDTVTSGVITSGTAPNAALTVEKCFIQQGTTGVTLETDSALNACFLDTVFETMTTGFDIQTGSSATFINCYTENIPKTGTTNVLFSVGVNGTSTNSGVLFIHGGNYTGWNDGAAPFANSRFINAGISYCIAVYGCNVQRFDKMLTTTAATKRIEFFGVTASQIGASPYSGINDFSVVLGSLPTNRTSGTPPAKLETQSIEMLTSLTTGWTITGKNDLTNPDLIGTVNGTEAFRWNASANLGLKVSSPITDLELRHATDTSALPLVISAGMTDGKYLGLGFRTYIGGANAVKSGIVHERLAAFGLGDLVFLVNGASSDAGVTMSDERMRVDSNGDTWIKTGDFTLQTAGKGIKIKEGSNARMGRSALVNGTVTVANTSVTANTEIFLTRRIQAGTTVGILSVGTVTAATSFVINSLDLAGALSADDDSTINWLLVEPSP